MLCTIDDVLAMPDMQNQAARPTAWLNKLIGAADSHIKDWCKQELEQSYYTEYYSGNTVRDIVCRQSPVLVGQTTLDPSPGIAVQTGLTTYAYVTYTGTTGTTFTGCTGGTGTLSGTANNAVFSPVVWWDPGGYYGQTSKAFPQTSQLVLGTNYVVEMDGLATRQLSRRALIRRIGGAGQGFIGFYPENFYSGKLGAYRLPVWPRGDGSVKVSYTAGWPLYSRELRAFNYACAMTVAQMVRIMPSGVDLASESMGNYSYAAKQAFESPEMGEIRNVLSTYREISIGND